jgi:hypothetical protein
MPNVYRIETYPNERYRDDGGYYYDVTKNGVPILTHVRYDEARTHVLTLIEDEDRYQEMWKGRVDYDCPGKVEKNPGDVYRVETRTGYRTEDGSTLQDVTKNGQAILTGVLYDRAFAHVLALIEDNDRYQEVCDGKVRSDESGMHMKRKR